jgi:hypothetical protein
MTFTWVKSKTIGAPHETRAPYADVYKGRLDSGAREIRLVRVLPGLGPIECEIHSCIALPVGVKTDLGYVLAGGAKPD